LTRCILVPFYHMADPNAIIIMRIMDNKRLSPFL
jgi:hypothetical protein